MPSGTFVPFDIIRFPKELKTLKTEERRPRGSDDPDADPVFTQLRFLSEERVGDFRVARIRHRKGVRVEGLWHGQPITQLVEQKDFDAYYAVSERIFIAHAPKEISLSAIDALTSEFGEIFELRTFEVDFSTIMPVALNVIGSWFKGMKHTNIRTQAAFGSSIHKDAEFGRMNTLGKHSNLIVVMAMGTDFFKVNISKQGSVYFMEEHPLSDCLRFVMHLGKYRIVVASAVLH